MIFACDVTALDADQRAEHFAWIRDELPTLLQGARELPNGLALQFSAAALPAVAVFLDRERRCCPFLRFGLELEPAGGPLHLQMTGPEGVLDFLRAEFNLQTAVTPAHGGAAGH